MIMTLHEKKLLLQTTFSSWSQLVKHISILWKSNVWEITGYGYDKGLDPHEPSAKLRPRSSWKEMITGDGGEM